MYEVLKRFYKWLIPLLLIAGSECFGQSPTDTISEEQIIYNQALKLIDSADYKSAIKELKKAVKIRNNYWEAYNLLGQCKVREKEYKEALKDLDKADKIAPMNFETMKWKGISYFLLNRFSESKVALDTAVYFAKEEKIDDAEMLFYRAQLMYKGKNLKAALETCEAAIEINPNYTEVYLLQAEIRYLRKEYNYVIKELTEAIKLLEKTKPDNRLYKTRAKSKFEMKDFKGAIRDWDQYMLDYPKEEEALISRAVAKISLDDNTGAIVDLDEAIKVNGTNPVSYNYRGAAKAGNRQYIEALKDIDFSIKLKFDYAPAYVNRAAIKFASKDKRGACEDLERADGLGDDLAPQLIERYCKYPN